MQLAMNLGMPADRLEREMTHRELRQWARYVRDHLLPFRRLEIYLAQIALGVARLGGNDTATLHDFMIDFGPERAEVVREPDAQAARAAFAFNPRKKPT